jgi:cytochrome c-type protein NapC
MNKKTWEALNPPRPLSSPAGIRRQSMNKKAWEALNRYCATCSRVALGAGVALLTLLVVGLLMGAGVAGLAWTNTEKFCIGCHEMRSTVYAEFKDTIHDKNRSGVRTTCADCHVPRETGAMLARKVEAVYDLYSHFISGTIDTKEKFEAHRATMANREWARMKQTDSLACRNCHDENAMSSDKQSEKAVRRHAKGKREGITCIDCHFAIAHQEPVGSGPQEMKLVKAKE